VIKVLLFALALTVAWPEAALARGWSKMPLVEVPALAATGDTLVIFYSGDSGWSPAPRDISAAFAKAGLPVVGVNSMRYYWRRRSVDEAAGDLADLIEHYALAWARPRVVLVGYSFGADALPLLLERLPAPTRTRVRAMALVSPADRAHLAFRFASWFDIPLPGGYPLAPALSDDQPTPALCIQGAHDRRAACRSFPPAATQVVVLPGGHHFYGERDNVAALILTAAGLTPPVEPGVAARCDSPPD
jgi:type IV secretory pathway VirJ component